MPIKQNDVSVDALLDTSDTYYLETLTADTQTLVSKFGEPEQTGKDGDKFQYEWKVQVKGRVYSIYDWKNEDGDFEELDNCVWHVAGKKMVKTDMKAINDFLGTKQKPEGKTVDMKHFLKWADDKIMVTWCEGCLCNSKSLKSFERKKGEDVLVFLNRVVEWVDKNEYHKDKQPGDPRSEHVFHFFNDELGEEYDEYQEESFTASEVLGIYEKMAN